MPTTWKWLEEKPNSNIRVEGGRYDFSPSEPLNGGYVLVRSITYGDLTGDGRDEAAVDLLYGTGGSASWHYLYVFTLANGSPRLLASLRSGSRADGGLLKVAIDENSLVLDFADSGRRIGDCCFDGYIRMRYRWRVGRFIEVRAREFGNLDRVRP